MTKLIGLLRQLLTGKDNTTHDVARWSWALSFIAVIGHSIWAAMSGHFPKLTDLAYALSALAAGHGIALGAKSSTEPDGGK